MRSPHRSALIRTTSIFAVSLWLAWPVGVWSQSITATLPVTGNAVAINRVTNKIYVAGGFNPGTVAVIDGTTHSIATLQAGRRPWAVAVNETTNKIYVADIGRKNLLDPAKGGVILIDGATSSITTVVDPNAHGPRSVAVNPLTNRIYVANDVSGNVTVIDGTTNATTTVTDPNASGSPYAIAVNAVTNKIYVANNNYIGGNNPGNVTVIDGATNSITTVMDPNAIGPNALAVNTVTNQIYVTNGGAYPAANHGNVTVIDGNINSTTTITDYNALSPQAVAVNETTNKIYVANANNSAVTGNGVVTVIEGTTNSITTVTGPSAQFPDAVAVNEATNMAYVANGGQNGVNLGTPGTNPGSVTVINGNTNAIITLIDPMAKQPGALAVDPLTNEIYVANFSSGNLTVIDGGGIATTHTLGVLLAGTGSGTVTSSPLGIDCGTTCEESVAAGTAVSLSTMASSGSAFAGWSGPCSGTGSCDVVANTDQFVTANFNSTAPMQVAVPNVVGETQAAAASAITGAGLVVGTVTRQSSSTVASGEVISESPAAGTNVTSGSTVNLVVSNGSSTSGGGGGVDSLTLGALLSVLMATLRRVPHRSARSCTRGRILLRSCPTCSVQPRSLRNQQGEGPMSRLRFGASVCLSLLLLISAGTVRAATLYVKCGGEGAFTSIGAALKALQSVPGPSTINVSGACNENVLIQNADRLTIAGSSGASINDASGGTLDVVDMRNSNVTLTGLTINGFNGENNDSVDCEQASHCTLIGNTIQGDGDAVGVYALSTGLIVGGILQNATAAGLRARGDVVAFGVTIQGNPLGVIVLRGGRMTAGVADPASVPVPKPAATTITNNSAGVLVTEGTEFLCAGCVIENNAGDGIHADVSAAATVTPETLNNGSVLQATITGNTGVGVYVGDLSSATFHGQPSVSGNAEPDIECNSATAVTRGAVAAAGAANTNCKN